MLPSSETFYHCDYKTKLFKNIRIPIFVLRHSQHILTVNAYVSSVYTEWLPPSLRLNA